MKRILVTCILLLMVTVAAAAQTDCPANVLLALARSGAACGALERNQACVGNGTVEGFTDSGTFTRPGDMIDLNDLRGVITSGEGDYPVVLMQVQANRRTSEQRSAAFVAFGELGLYNMVPPVPTLVVTSTGTLNIRSAPDIEAEIVARVALRETAVANGRTNDATWLRVIVPDDPNSRNANLPEFGWVSLDGPLNLSADVGTLTAVDLDAPFIRPFAEFGLEIVGTEPPCPGAPESGLLIQSPSVDAPVDLTVFPLRIRLAGTAFFQYVPNNQIHILDGYAEISDPTTRWYVPAGARLFIENYETAGVLQPLDPLNLVGLPINLLPQRIRIAAPLPQSEIDSRNASYYVPTPTPAPTLSPEELGLCQRRLRQDDSLRAGPGSFYEVTNSVRADQLITPVFQTTDPDGAVWWQLRNTSWIRASLVAETGECEPVPVLEVVRPPRYNALSLENCATTNGPIRAGQYVEITFIPPAFETVGEAVRALQVDPGTVKINDVGRYVYASEPVLIGPERYVRTFYTSWEATAGTHRIVGQRLSYVVTCSVTVPVG